MDNMKLRRSMGSAGEKSAPRAQSASRSASASAKANEAKAAAAAPPAKVPSGAAPPTSTNPKYILKEGPYDFAENRSSFKPTTVIECIAHLVKGCLGAGVLGIHEAYMKCGLWTSLVLTLVLGVFVGYCISLLVASSQTMCTRLHVPALSYPDLAEAALVVGPFPKLRKCSRCFRYAIDATICIDLFGSCCVYEIIIARSIKQLVENVPDSPDEGNPHIRVYILALLPLIILICLIRSLKYLAPFSIVANIFIVICVGATIYYGTKIAPPLSERPAFASFTGLFEFCGVCVFSMEGVGVAMAIENSMQNPHQFPIVLIGGYFIVVAFVCLVGFFGYWGWGDECMGSITLNLPLEPFPIAIKVLVALMIYITFALNFWAPFNLIWIYLKKNHPESKHLFWECIYRILLIVAITAAAIAFPKILPLMGLIGAFCISLVGFIFPAFIDILVVHDDPGFGFLKWRLIKNIVIIVIGFVLMCLGTYFSGLSLFL